MKTETACAVGRKCIGPPLLTRDSAVPYRRRRAVTGPAERGAGGGRFGFGFGG